jgi:hypothetical protein
VGQLPGNVKRFTIHTDIFTKRSRFLAAARKPEWIAEDPSKPVDLSDEDLEVFQAYLNCVYVGPEILEEVPGAFECEVCDSTGGCLGVVIKNVCKDVTKENLVAEFKEFGEIEKVSIYNKNFRLSSTGESSSTAEITFTAAEAGVAAYRARDGRVLNGHQLTVKLFRSFSMEYEERKSELADSHYDRLITLYLLADKLQDFATANMVMDKVQQFCSITRTHPGKLPVRTAYQSTADGSPLRNLLRDMWFYDARPEDPVRFEESGFPLEFLHDIFTLYLKIKVHDEDIDCFLDVTYNDNFLFESEHEIPNGCRYHQHDDQHPFCSTSSKKEEPCKSCKAASKK